jgi:F0F1-type ATP synthase assembly protein I
MLTAFVVDTGLAAAILSTVTDQFADAGTLLIVGLVAGIPLAFYVIRRIVGLVPKGK